MSHADVIYRPFRPGDEVAVNEGFNRVFDLERPMSEWGWKFPPDEGGRLIVGAWQDDELLAHYAGQPVRLQVDGRVWPAAQIVDVFSTPAARGHFSRRGVWVRTVERFFAEFGESGRVSLLYGFPSPRPLRLGVLQLGYDSLPPQPITYLSRPVRAPRLRPRRLLYRAEPARDWEPRLDQLWARCGGDYPVAVVRDAEHALRRLAGHPTVSYHRFLILPRLSESPVGFVAFRTDAERCQWVDVVWDHAHPGVLNLAAHLSSRVAGAAGAEVEELWLNGDPEGRRQLEGHGFVVAPEPRRLVMVAKAFAADLELGALDGRTYLTLADTDLA